MYRFIVNPNAGAGRGFRIWRRIERKLSKDGREYIVYFTANQGEAARISRTITTEDGENEVIVTVGGEGTYNEVLNGISFKGVQTMGYISAGFRNALSRGFRSYRDINKQIKSVLDPTDYRLMDYAVITSGDEEIFNRRFAGRCGIGLEAEICGKVFSGRFKFPLRGLFIALRQLLITTPIKGSIVFDGDKKVEFNNIYFISFKVHSDGDKKKKRRKSGIFGRKGASAGYAAESGYADQNEYEDEEREDDGKMTVYIASTPYRFRVISILMDISKRNIKQRHGVHIYECREASVHLARPAAVHTDGESCGSQQDMEVRCIPKKIKMIKTGGKRRFHANRTRI